VLAAIQAHSDDIPLFAGGLVAKLVDEGYTGYLIRISNDESSGRTLGHGVVQNEIDNQEVARALGCKKAFSFYYRNHRMDDCAEIEIRARLIFLFRVLQVTTIVAMDPYNHYDENPDHLVAGRVAEAACWMAGGPRIIGTVQGWRNLRASAKYYHARSRRATFGQPYRRHRFYIDHETAATSPTAARPGNGAGSRLRAERPNRQKVTLLVTTTTPLTSITSALPHGRLAHLGEKFGLAVRSFPYRPAPDIAKH
jgi:LmbE family N-acetylglucosaminyl deacetylase